MTLAIDIIGIGSGAGATPFTPLSRGASLLAWYRSDLGVTNVAGAASAWADQSGQGDANRNLSQATSSQRPTIIASNALFGGRPTLRFSNAASSVLPPVGNWSVAIAQPVTIYSVHSTSSISTQNTYYSDYLTNLRFQMYQSAGGGTGMVGYAGNANVGSAENLINSCRVVCTIFDGASSTMYDTQLTASATGNMGTNGSVGLQVGASRSGAGANADIAEVVVINGHDGSTQRAQMMAYLGALYSVTIGG